MKSSRQIDEVIGIDHDRQHDDRRQDARLLRRAGEERDPAEVRLCRNGSTWSSMNGPSTKIPQRPTTTLGTAASIAISDPIGPRIAGGASSLRKRPIAIESGAAISIRAERGDERADDERAGAEDVP